MKKLVSHLKDHIREDRSVSCPVSGCTIVFTKKSSFTSHMCRKHVAIMEVLPQLQAINKNILEEHLQSIGVETYDNLMFITEADLLTALRPVQARKLLSVWKQKCK